MKKGKMTKEEKTAFKFKKNYERLCHLIGKDAADSMMFGMVEKGHQEGKISDEEYNNLIEFFNQNKDGVADETGSEI